MTGRRVINSSQSLPIALPRTGIRGLSGTAQLLLGLLAVGLLAAGLYLVPSYAAYGLAFLGLGVPLALLIWFRPELGLLALLFLTSSFVPANIIDVRLPIGGGLDLRDLVLLGLFGLVFLRELVHKRLEVPWWPVGGPLLLFLVMAVFSGFYAIVFRNVETNWALSDLRILILYVTFFVVLWSIERPGQLKTLLVGLFIIADLTTTIVILQQFLGGDDPLLEAMTGAQTWRLYQQGGVVRVVPAGHVLMHFTWFIALGLLIFARRKPRLRAFCVAQLLYIGGGLLFPYMRAQWVAMIVGLGLAGIILIPSYKQHLAKVVVIGGSVSLLLAVVIASGPLSELSATPFVAGITERFASILMPAETLETESLVWRRFEMEKALQAIGKQPLTGVGLGARYRDLVAYNREASGSLSRGSLAAGDVSRFTRYVHNSYVSIAVKMGIPGLIVLLWFCAAALFKGFRVYRDMPDSEYKGVVLGVLLGFAGLLVWSYFHAHLIRAESTGVIAVMIALVGSQAYSQGSGLRSIRDRSLPERS